MTNSRDEWEYSAGKLEVLRLLPLKCWVLFESHLCCKSLVEKSLSRRTIFNNCIIYYTVGKTDLSEHFRNGKPRICGRSASGALCHELINGRRHHSGFDTTDKLLGDVSFFQMISNRLYTDLRDLPFFTKA